MELKTLFVLTGFKNDVDKINKDIADFSAWVASHFPGITISGQQLPVDLQPVFTPYTPGTSTTDVVSSDWVRQNILPLTSLLGAGFFECFYLFNENLMPRPSTIGGEMLGKMGDVWMCPVTGTIDEQVSTGDGKVHDNAIVHRLEHEFLHVCEYVTGMYNVVHQYDGTATAGLDLETPAAVLRDPFLKALTMVNPVDKNAILKLIAQLQAQVAVLMAQLAHKSRLNEFALAIQSFEDYVLPGGKFRDGRPAPNGSRSFQNKNPGNLKFAGQKWAIGKDDQGHAIFDTYAHGFDRLVNQLVIAVNAHGVYNGNMSLRQFFHVYAEGNSNEYAEFVSKKLGISPDSVPIKSLA